MARTLKQFWQKEGAGLALISGQDIARAEWILALPDRQLVQETLEARRHMKSPRQLGYYYAGIVRPSVQILRERGEDDLAKLPVTIEVGLETNEDNLDSLIKRAFQVNKQLTKPPAKGTMTDEMMGQLIDFASDWLPRALHVPVLPAIRS